jgi:asparagine synthase (glutamine-hydrolysing)
MCGIAGVVSADPELRKRVGDMVAAIRHRGPDEAGVVDLGQLALGTARLAILDPKHGHQPMSTDDGRITVVFNGEIYNYRSLRQTLEADGARFRTDCDTEILLHLYDRYGSDLLNQLDGMFAIGLWDAPKRQLLLARDQLGQKPLFYSETGGALAFASEIRALLTLGLVEPKTDLEALYHYLSLRFIPDDRTLLQGVRKLQAGHCLILDADGCRKQRYWSLDRLPALEGSDSEIIDAVDLKLRGVVEAHLQSDVQVGSFLSGGIDSSLITAMACKSSPASLPTFSVGVKEDDFNELPWARRVAKQYQTHHHEEIVEPDLVEILPDIVWHLEEPADPFAVGVYVASALASRHVKVVLSGDGGDELFAGYDRYWGNRLATSYGFVPSFIREGFLQKIIGVVPETFSYKSTAEKLKWIQHMARFDGGQRYAESMSFLRFKDQDKARLFSREARESLTGVPSAEKILLHYESAEDADLVYRMLYTDLMTRMPGHLLPIVDRMSMAHGVEVRAPLLEHRMVEFAMRVPSRLKLRKGRLKHVLREVASRYLDDELVNRGKQGFGFPIAHWLQHDLRGTLDRTIESSSFVKDGVFDGAYLRELRDDHTQGRSDHNLRLWLILNLEIWHRLFVDGWSVDATAGWIRDLRGRSAETARVVAQ